METLPFAFLESLDWTSIAAMLIIAAIIFMVVKFRTWLFQLIKTVHFAIKRRRQMSIEKKLWRKFGIVSQVIEMFPVFIEKRGEAYLINFNISISLKSQDDRNASIIYEDATANISGEDFGRETGHIGKGYLLLSSQKDKLIVPPKSSINRSYSFSREYKLEPSIKSLTTCMIQIGYADIQSVIYHYRIVIKQKVNVHRR